MRHIFIICIISSFTCRCGAQSFIKSFSNGDELLAMNNITAVNTEAWYASGVARDDSGRVSTFLSRLNPDGTSLWCKSIQDAREARALVALSDGSALVFNNNIGFQGYFDASVVHIGASGDFIREIIWGEAGAQDDWFDAQKIASGEVIAIGMSREENSVEEQILLAKFSLTGQVLWEKAYTGGKFGRFSEILSLASGDFYALGQNYTNGNNDGMIGKFAADGTLLWVKTYCYNPLECYFLAGQILPDGSLWVATYLVNQNASNTLLTLLHINANGDVIEQKSFKNPYDLLPFKMGGLSDGTLLIAAQGGQLSPTINYDYVLLQVSPQGDLINQIGFGSDNQEYGADAFFSGQEVVLCGNIDSDGSGTARRACIAKSDITSSCCEKNITIETTDSPETPLINTLIYTSGVVPPRQNRIVALNDFSLTVSTSCQKANAGTLLPANKTLCVGDTILLEIDDNLSGSVTWNTGDTTYAILIDEAAIYSVTLNSECGSFSDTLEVLAVGNRVILVVEQPDDVCPGTQVELRASGGSDFVWYNTNGEPLFFVPDTILEVNLPTKYTVVASDGQCRDTASIEIGVLSLPLVSAGQDITIKLGEQVRLSATGAITYNWLPSAGLSCEDCTNPFASPSFTTTYTLIGTDSNNCNNTDSVIVYVDQPCPYYIPNVFNPVSDINVGNDRFGVIGNNIDPDGYLLRVYSRWGELVFESNQPGVSWDGTFRNHLAAPGVYLYQLQMNTCGGMVSAQGDITLLR